MKGDIEDVPIELDSGGGGGGKVTLLGRNIQNSIALVSSRAIVTTPLWHTCHLDALVSIGLTSFDQAYMLPFLMNDNAQPHPAMLVEDNSLE
ncbi:hypothetical protein TNCV_1167851 [Trichonephila clavipes]|uniref:Uncharacterized protein n=1 Tax=Trichonephila clavipes TaxID=2585209 RepID=A0A8X6T0Y6_TRICX|nr:hypothetical protein TNCV_1167851 [Trichonephila clavipes]